MAEKTEKAKEKRPSALKRKLQSDKRKLSNRSHRASVQTAIRRLNTALESKEDSSVITERLSILYQLVDKGVKKGVYKDQKAARTKSRASLRVAKAQS